jgi:hypothetical protein
VSRDRAAFNEIYNLTHQTAVPQTVINGEAIIGFDERKLKEKLGVK